MGTSVVRFWCFCHMPFIEILFSLISLLAAEGNEAKKEAAIFKDLRLLLSYSHKVYLQNFRARNANICPFISIWNQPL